MNSSIYKRALGTDFERLHPQIQRRFSLSSTSCVACLGSGIMERVWHGALYTLPFLYVGAWRRIMFPDTGTDIPFTIENYAFRDPFGRDTVTWIRKFATPHRRRFDAYMIYSEQRGCIVDYLGTHQHLAVDIDVSVDERGGLQLRSGAQRFYEGPAGFSFPLLFSGVAEVYEWYNEARQRFEIEVNVHNRTWGPLFGYKGHFQVDWRPVEPGVLPDDLRPARFELRE